MFSWEGKQPQEPYRLTDQQRRTQATWKAADGHAWCVAREWKQYCCQAEN